MSAIETARARLRRPWFGSRAGSPSRGIGRAKERAEVGIAEKCFVAALAALLVLSVWLVLFAKVFSGLQESGDQARIYTAYRSQLAQETATLGGTIKRGSPVAMLESDKAGFHDLVVVEGTTSSQLRSGPGLYPTSPLPGQPGISTIMAKGLTYGAPFGEISQLSKGDSISVTTGQGVFRYTVVDVRRSGDPLPAPVATGSSRLTLVTAANSGWQNAWASSGTVFVDANLQGAAQLPPPGHNAATPADSIMKPDLTGLYPLVLWLQLMLIAVIFAVWATIRWGRWQAWLIASPIVLFAVWAATNCAALLVPNIV
jgi:sortase A